MGEEDKIELHRGLRDVYIDRTKSSFIDGKEGKLLYRGYNIHDLAEKSTFEECVYLLLHGVLPTKQELEQLDSTLKLNRELPNEIIEIIRLLKNAHPMDVLRTTISALSTYDPETSDNSPDATSRKGIRLTAASPSIVAAHHRIRHGKDVLSSKKNLSHAANFLYLLFGEEPDPEDAKLIDKDFILHAEHGVNASTFAARIAASTDADFHAAVTAGMAVLKGSSHGGAAEAVMQQALEIGDEKNAEKYIKDLLKNGGRVMGFGHRVYRAVDPRSVHLAADAKSLGERKGQPGWFSILQAVSKVMEPYARRGVRPNVDFWSGAIYYLLEIPEDLFISIFAMGRIPGWTQHVMEQYENNILLRPRLLYTGPMDLKYIPIDERS